MATSKDVTRFTWQHIRNGYIGFILIVDFSLLIVFVTDIYRYRALGLSLAVPLSYFFTYDEEILTFLINILLYLLIIIPIGISFFRAISNIEMRLGGWFVRRTRTSIFLHIILSHVVLFITMFSLFMERASGIKGVEYRVFLFNSITIGSINRIIIPPWGFLLALLLPTIFAQLINTIFLWGKQQLPKWLREYVARVRLQDLGGIYYPTYCKRQMNFNMAVAPEIAFIKRMACTYFRKYQRQNPGSQRSSIYMQHLLDSTRILFTRLFLSGLKPDSVYIEFFPGTGRALEVALQRIKNLNTVILSPFEHYCLDSINGWLNITRSIKHRKIQFTKEDLYSTWNKQEEKIVQELIKTIKEENGPIAIVISEVASDSGIKIPVSKIFTKVTKELGRIDNINLVIDGAHGLGNIGSPDLGSLSGVYIASAHKWLFASEPCGILISHVCQTKKTYDSWDARLPISTGSARMIANLYATLQFIELQSLDSIRTRSSLLRNRFIEKIQEANCGLGIIGNSHSNMISIYPDGTQWRMGNDVSDIKAYFYKNKVNVQVVEPDNSRPWVRVAFPYFLQVNDIDSLINVLVNAVE